jgi:hypothetical protein
VNTNSYKITESRFLEAYDKITGIRDTCGSVYEVWTVGIGRKRCGKQRTASRDRGKQAHSSHADSSSKKNHHEKPSPRSAKKGMERAMPHTRDGALAVCTRSYVYKL